VFVLILNDYMNDSELRRMKINVEHERMCPIERSLFAYAKFKSEIQKTL
jgi:hypothetical protein